jgi:hypothetical protein
MGMRVITRWSAGAISNAHAGPTKARPHRRLAGKRKPETGKSGTNIEFGPRRTWLALL